LSYLWTPYPWTAPSQRYISLAWQNTTLESGKHGMLSVPT
jgi:hypothetical protein